MMRKHFGSTKLEELAEVGDGVEVEYPLGVLSGDTASKLLGKGKGNQKFAKKAKQAGATIKLKVGATKWVRVHVECAKGLAQADPWPFLSDPYVKVFFKRAGDDKPPEGSKLKVDHLYTHSCRITYLLHS